MQESSNSIIDELVKAGYHSLVRNGSRREPGSDILSQARLGIMTYLTERQLADIFLQDKDMQRYVTLCAQYIVALFLFISLKTEREQAAKMWSSYSFFQQAEEVLVRAYQHLIGLPQRGTAILAEITLQLVSSSPALLPDGSVPSSIEERGLATCSRHMALVNMPFTEQEEQRLRNALECLTRNNL